MKRNNVAALRPEEVAGNKYRLIVSIIMDDRLVL